MSIKNSIPNFVTCCSLISGCIACIMALRGNLPMATLWIVIAAVFDFGDGFAARSLHAYSPMGKELDSLSDMVSFGVAPGMIVYWLLEQACMTAPVLGGGRLCSVYGSGDTGLFRVASRQVQYR